MASKRFFGVLLAVACLGSYCSAGDSSWKVFSNRAGWKISYPPDWSIATCPTCDPEAPDVYVNFFPPKKNEPDGSVFIERVASKPAQTRVDDWLSSMSKSKEALLHRETKITLNGMPARKLDYRSSSGDDRESVYVVAGSDTFHIEFSSERAHTPLRYLANYPTYLKMLNTFQVTH